MTHWVDRREFLRTTAGFAAGLGAGGIGFSPRRSGPPVPARLADALRGEVIVPSSHGFAAAAHVYNERFDYVRPKAVARALDADDVRSAVRWAVAHDVRLVARSGGHSYAGYSTAPNAIVLDLRSLRSITINRGRATATIGPGAQLIDVYTALAAHGVTIPAGSCPSVGVGGHALGGGMGLAGRAFGLTADNLIAVQLVTADGRVRTVDKHTDPELLWALRGGGGGNFGVATKLTFRLHRMPASAAWFHVSWPWSRASSAIEAWLSWAPHAPDRMTPLMALEATPNLSSISASGQYLGPASDLDSLLAPLTAVGGAAVVKGDKDYLGLQRRWAGCALRSVAQCHTIGTSPGGALERASFRAKSDILARPLPAHGRSVLVGAIESLSAQGGVGAVLFDCYGGAINRVAPHDTAFIHRNDLASLQYLDYGGGGGWLNHTYAAMRPYVSGYAYQNYIDPDLKSWRHAYYGSNYPKLLSVQRRVDPAHFFNFPQAIGR